MGKQVKLAVIGAGIGGIALAIRMAVRDFHVDVYEKNKVPGGKIAQIQHEDFRFDTGPSLFTLPHLLDELFALAGKNRADYFKYAPLNLICTYYFPDGKCIKALADTKAFAEEVFEKTGENPDKVIRYLHEAKALYALSSPVFLYNSFHKLSVLFKRKNLSVLLKLHKLDFLMSLYKRNARSFHSEHLIRIFDRYATYNGSSPYKSPATMKMISHLEHNSGAFFPEKGMYDLLWQLYQLALELGVKFHFQAPVEKILIHNGICTGIQCKGEKLNYDKVISNADIYGLYGKLLPGYKLYRGLRTPELSSSALIFYWGIRPRLEMLQLHNILFSADYRKEFQTLFSEKKIYQDPTVYIFISKRMVENDAPEGADNCFVMINVPPDSGQNWEWMIEDARRNIIAKIHQQLHIDIEERIVFEQIISPQSLAAKCGAYRGALYGQSSHSLSSAFFRHANFSRRIKNLYFCGGTVHPGGGIPLCLASAGIVDALIL